MKNSILSIFALFLFAGIYPANAQNTSKGDGKIYVKILKEIDGKQILIDTVFEENDKAAADEFMKQHGVGAPDRRNSNVDINIDGKEMEDALRLMEESLHESGRAIEKMSEELAKELERIHIDVETDDDAYSYQFNFNDLNMEQLQDELNKSFDIKIDTAGKDFSMSFNFKGIDAQTQQEIENSMRKAKEELKQAMENMNDKKVNIKIKIDADKDKIKNEKRIEIKKGKPTTDKANYSAILKLKIFPNPNKGNFDITFSTSMVDDLNIQLTDAAGKTISSENTSQFTGKYERSFNLKNRGKGVYFLKIVFGKETINEKIIVE
nr:T9SS type A sorting domain-containing protein [Bacteroidota bacterium]